MSKQRFSLSTIFCVPFFILILISHTAWLHWRINHLSQTHVSPRCESNSTLNNSSPDSGLSTATGNWLYKLAAWVRDDTYHHSHVYGNSSDASVFNESRPSIEHVTRPAQDLYHSARTSPETFNLPKDIKWDTFHQSLNLSLTLQTPDIGKSLLVSLRPIDHFGLKHSFELFKIAAQLDDVFTATRLISNIRKYGSQKAVAQSSTFWSPNIGDGEVIDGLPSNWVWAYMRAHQECSGVTGGFEVYWTVIASRFMMNLAP